MDALNLFEKDLAALIGRPTDLRPFVCDGSPLDCQAFIVGFMPATGMADDFWTFWRSGHGFDKARWFDAYKLTRMLRPFKPGKTRRNPISNTRRVIGWILEGAAPVSCLETNLFSTPCERKKDFPQERRDAAPFEFLIKKIRPQIIITFDVDAKRHLDGMHLSAPIIYVANLSRGWSQAAAFELGCKIKAGCGGDPTR